MTVRVFILIVATSLIFEYSVAASEHFTHRFGSDPVNPRIMTYIGRNPSEAITQTGNGLFVTFPIEPPNGGMEAGVATLFKIHGDFEITLGYELVDVEQPHKGHGAGVVVRLPLAGEPQRGVGFAHRIRSNGDNVFTALLMTHVDGEPQYDQEVFHTDVHHGQLRLVRDGSNLRFLVAEGDSEDFRQLRRIEIGGEPLKSVRVLGDTGGSEQSMTILFSHISIRADELPVELPPTRQRLVSRAWLILGSVGVVVLIGSCAWYMRRRR